ncbi:MAG: hypothetical protein AMXMBFR84_23100 [Candidatus Hydrogenedentota bacterium]
MSRALALGLVLVALPALAHEPGQATIEHHVTTEAKPWTHLNVNNDPDSFQFGLVTDNAGGPRDGIFRETMDKLNLMQPEFVMSVGDFIEGYENTVEQLDLQWERFLKDVARLKMPFFFVPGNHDNGKPLWAEVYNRRFGVPYYHFKYKNVLFLCLSSNDAPDNSTGIGEAQIAYVKKTLEENQDVRWTLVFQHKPLWNDEGALGWKEVEALLKGRKVSVFAGHTHNYLSQERDGISFITMATSGGGSQLRGAAFGEFDHFAWITMTDDGPIVANLMLDGVQPADLRTPEMAEELALFRSDKAVTATPILYAEGEFQQGKTTFTATNPSSKPLRFKAVIESQPGVRAEPNTVEAVIPGGATHTVDIAVTADTPLQPGAVRPLVAHWEGNYGSGANTAPITLKGQRRILVDAPMSIPVVESAPAIDGTLDDWKDLPFDVSQPADIYVNVPAWKGPQDGSFTFAVSRDEVFLYVAVKALDNDLCFDGWKYWEDFATVAVDPRGSADQDIRESAFSIMTGPEMDAEQAAEYEIGKKPEGVKTASVKTENGFTTEFAIPLAALDALQAGGWKHVRLNVGVSDFDPSDARDGVTILYWRPQFTSPHSYPEAGLFVK